MAHDAKYLKRLERRQRLYQQRQAKKQHLTTKNKLLAKNSNVFMPTGQAVYGDTFTPAPPVPPPPPPPPPTLEEKMGLVEPVQDRTQYWLVGPNGEQVRIYPQGGTRRTLARIPTLVDVVDMGKVAATHDPAANVRENSTHLMQHQKELMDRLLPEWDNKEPSPE